MPHLEGPNAIELHQAKPCIAGVLANAEADKLATEGAEDDLGIAAMGQHQRIRYPICPVKVFPTTIGPTFDGQATMLTAALNSWPRIRSQSECWEHLCGDEAGSR